jgi:hypothetical protein
MFFCSFSSALFLSLSLSHQIVITRLDLAHSLFSSEKKVVQLKAKNIKTLMSE